MNFDANTAARMLEVFGVGAGRGGKLALSGEMGRAVTEWGLDFYREICCGWLFGCAYSDCHVLQILLNLPLDDMYFELTWIIVLWCISQLNIKSLNQPIAFSKFFRKSHLGGYKNLVC